MGIPEDHSERTQTKQTLIGQTQEHPSSLMNGVPTKGNWLSIAQYSVCHKKKKNFVDRKTGAHKQHIERAWQNHKLEVWCHRGYHTPESLKLHLKIIIKRYAITMVSWADFSMM